jgi:hypothetical protein
MQFDELDNRIREAAEHHHPAYDEKAWGKMEKMLDKHMPQEKEKKRRFLFWFLLPLLLVGGGAALLIAKPWKKDSSVVQATTSTINNTDEKQKEQNDLSFVKDKNRIESTEPKEQQSNNISGNDQPLDNTPGGKTVIPAEQLKRPSGINSSAGANPLNKAEEGIAISMSSGSAKKKKVAKGKPVSEEVKPITTADKFLTQGDKSVADLNKPIAKTKDEKVTTEVLPVNPSPVIVAEAKEADIPLAKEPEAVNKTETANNKKEEVTDTNVVKTAKKQKVPKSSSFFASVSVGADLSFVGGNKAGSVKPISGFGVGYIFKEKITLRTGFYSGRKVYSATAESYNPPDAFNQLYPYLEKVDADCKVYEIPISLAVDFGKKPSEKWFVSAGISSFLMKKETYDYYYKYTPTGTTYSQEWTIKDENFHYFSVATISGGYKRNIGKRMFFMAEPYVKLPLGGVGFGKVRLNSAGVLFTVAFKPFGR